MVWKYIIIGFLLVAFIFGYPQINEFLELPFRYKDVVLVGPLVLIFVVTPLYWRAIVKKGKKERESLAAGKQPWD